MPHDRIIASFFLLFCIGAEAVLLRSVTDGASPGLWLAIAALAYFIYKNATTVFAPTSRARRDQH